MAEMKDNEGGVKLDAKRPMDLLRSLIDPGSDTPRVSDAKVDREPNVKAAGIEKTPMASDAKVQRTPEIKHSSSDPIHKHGEKMRQQLAALKVYLRDKMEVTDDKEVEHVLAAFRSLESRKNEL